MRRGVRVGIDVGSVRVGVAQSDPAGLLATPVMTVRRVSDADGGPRGDDGLSQVAEVVRECEALEVIVGLPLGLSGNAGAAAALARGYAERIAQQVAPVPVRLVDERLSTVTATRALRDAGVKQRRHRPVVDQAAAVVILQSALDAERASGRPPGSLVDPATAPRSGTAPESPVSS
jgi:putative holliday junction resolvase